MSQPVGFQYKSRIPTLSDDATIVEALKVYHYGVDDYSTEPIPDDSIEGNFRTFGTAITALQSAVSGLGTTYVEQVSLTATPNVITGQSTTTTPLTIRSIASQTSPLQQWQNSSSVNVGSVGASGNMNLAGYLTIGTTTQSTTIGLNVVTGNAAHNGIVVKAQTSQTANIQEWQNSGGTAMAWVDKDGKVFSNGIQTSTITGVETLTNKTLTSPVITTGTKSAIFTSGQYYLLSSDMSKVLFFSDGGTIIIPNNLSLELFPIGASICVVQLGVSQITIKGDTGVNPPSVYGTDSTLGSFIKTRTQYSFATILKTGSNDWLVFGDTVQS